MTRPERLYRWITKRTWISYTGIWSGFVVGLLTNLLTGEWLPNILWISIAGVVSIVAAHFIATVNKNIKYLYNSTADLHPNADDRYRYALSCSKKNRVKNYLFWCTVLIGSMATLLFFITIDFIEIHSKPKQATEISPMKQYDSLMKIRGTLENELAIKERRSDSLETTISFLKDSLAHQKEPVRSLTDKSQ